LSGLEKCSNMFRDIGKSLNTIRNFSKATNVESAPVLHSLAKTKVEIMYLCIREQRRHACYMQMILNCIDIPECEFLVHHDSEDKNQNFTSCEARAPDCIYPP